MYTYRKMLNKHYQQKQRKIWKEARERYQNLSEEEKRLKRPEADIKFLLRGIREKSSVLSSSK